MRSAARRAIAIVAALIVWCVAVMQGADLKVRSYGPGADLNVRGHAEQAEGQAAPSGVHAEVAFETSDNCLACHNGLRTAGGEDVSIGIAWRASMMANSARDPYWQAAVRRETLDHPTKKAVIEDECAICHMPMAHTTARSAGRHGEVFKLLPTATGADPLKPLAADGVSCSLCHQLSSDRLGSRQSFVGGFVVAAPEGPGRRMFGPYDIDKGRTSLMQSATGVRPAQSEHLRQSEVCATCHTLYTEAFDEAGQSAGSLPEQVPYLEWRHSAFAGERSCQACHMPEVASVPISSVLGEPRDRLSRHTFLGGNFFMLRMLAAHASELGVIAPPAELDATASATLHQLSESTATVSIARAEAVDGTLSLDIDVRNLTGHKLPTGYPSRRVWLYVAVRDARGTAIFESGALQANGAIRGNDNDLDPLRLEPHHTRITEAGQVQIYEAVMGDSKRQPTTGLLRATMFLKDNRLLPRGFDKRTAQHDIAVVGEAADDPDFTSEADRVGYSIPIATPTGSLQVEVALRYQPIGFRWAENLRSYDAAEPKRFVRFYDEMASASSAVLARASVLIAR